MALYSSRFRLATHLSRCRNFSTSDMTVLRRYSTQRDEPKPFLNSKAHRFKVDHAYTLSESEMKRGKYAFPLGFTLFGIITYMGFIREYGETDRAVMKFLTRDISDRIPPHKLERIKQSLEEEKVTNIKQQ